MKICSKIVTILKVWIKSGIHIWQTEGVIKLIKHFANYFFLRPISKVRWIDYLFFNISAKILYDFMSVEKDLDDVLYTAYNYFGYGHYRKIFPLQNRSEIRSLVEILKRRSPQIIMEIGTAQGGTLYIWSRSLKSLKKIISIDLPSGYPKEKIKFFKLFNNNIKFHFIRGNSHNKEIVNRLCQILGNVKIDFLFIDGDHSYEGVKQDFEMYKPFVASGGIIAFHDIVTFDPSIDVSKFWKEVKNKYRSEEIVAKKNEKYNVCGIGILYI